MRAGEVIVALDSFKGSLDATRACAALAGGLRTHETRHVVELPIADGGEGTLDALASVGFRRTTVDAHDPMGRPITSGFVHRDGVAVVELADASGLSYVDDPSPATALAASGAGTGEVMAAALDAGFRRLVVGIGGSATTDGGTGLLVGLGARLIDGGGRTIAAIPSPLLDVRAVDLASVPLRLRDVELTVATDVDNVLLGPSGAAAIYGPQKGADDRAVATLDAALARWSELLCATTDTDVADARGAGAAGGAGFALLALGATRRSGLEVVLQLAGLTDRIATAGCVVTGEGSLDEQTLRGKAPAGVAALAATVGVPVVAVAGRSRLDHQTAAHAGFAAVHTLGELEPDARRSMADAERLLRRLGEQIRLP